MPKTRFNAMNLEPRENLQRVNHHRQQQHQQQQQQQQQHSGGIIKSVLMIGHPQPHLFPPCAMLIMPPSDTPSTNSTKCEIHRQCQMQDGTPPPRSRHKKTGNAKNPQVMTKGEKGPERRMQGDEKDNVDALGFRARRDELQHRCKEMESP